MEPQYEKFLKALHESIPKEVTPSLYVADALGISYDTALRRLNGKVVFTLDEIAILSRKLQISLDEIIGVQVEDKASFKLHLLAQTELAQIYNNKIKGVTMAMKHTRMESDYIRASIAINNLSYSFILPFSALSKFFLYRWLHQKGGIKPSLPMSSMVIPENIKETQKGYIEECNLIDEVTVILDRNIFKFALYNIKHFYKVGLISNEECMLLKTDLHNILAMLEYNARNGRTESGTKYNLFLSSIDIDASLTYFESNRSHTSQFSVYTIYTLDSTDDLINKYQKEWLESLKRFSVKISECEEYIRASYLNEQRKLIDTFFEDMLVL